MKDLRQHHASPWVIDTRALGLMHRGGPGIAQPVQMAAPVGDGWSSGVLSVEPGATVTITGLLESVSEGVLVSGTVAAPAVGSCARCLTDIRMQVTAEFRELFAYPDSLTAQTTDADEIPRIEDDLIDLEPLAHDEIVLAMPTIALCSPQCPGLCPQCGEPLGDVGPDHRHETIDPRWAALAGLVVDDSAVSAEEQLTDQRVGDSEEN